MSAQAHADHGAPSSFVRRWLYSTNHKDIGTMYLVFAILAAFIGRTNEAWIDVPVGGQTYYGQCNQICGVNHAYMPIEVKALPKAEYAAWLANAKKEFASNEVVPAQTEVTLASAK